MIDWHEELDRRCVGTNRAGERCRHAPIVGGNVCWLHGGRSPNAQAAAKARLLAMVEPVLGVFESIVETWHSTRCTGCGHVDENGVKCVGCGKPTGDPMPVIRVGQLVLDRAGFHPTLAVQQAPPAPDPYKDLTQEQLEARALRLVEMVRAQRLPPMGSDDEPRLLPEVTDGFIVPDDEREQETQPKPDLDGAKPHGELDPEKVDDAK
jgi:hypothetical protein